MRTLGDVAVGHRQLVPRRQALEQLDRLRRERLALPDPADEEQQA